MGKQNGVEKAIVSQAGQRAWQQRDCCVCALMCDRTIPDAPLFEAPPDQKQRSSLHSGRPVQTRWSCIRILPLRTVSCGRGVCSNVVWRR